jgi:hypothetical protein
MWGIPVDSPHIRGILNSKDERVIPQEMQGSGRRPAGRSLSQVSIVVEPPKNCRRTRIEHSWQALDKNIVQRDGNG